MLFKISLLKGFIFTAMYMSRSKSKSRVGMQHAQSYVKNEHGGLHMMSRKSNVYKHMMIN